MGNGLKINPTPVPKYGKGIKPTKVDDTSRVSFSFRRLKSEDKKFKFELKESQYFLKLIDRLKSYCSFTRQELLSNRSSSIRCHKIDFKDPMCSEKSFGLISEDVDDEAYQLEISSNEHGRIHGYFVGNVFYLVWLDPSHELYAGK